MEKRKHIIKSVTEIEKVIENAVIIRSNIGGGMGGGNIETAGKIEWQDDNVIQIKQLHDTIQVGKSPIVDIKNVHIYKIINRVSGRNIDSDFETKYIAVPRYIELECDPGYIYSGDNKTFDKWLVSGREIGNE
jgi:hypothetical protein